MSFLRLFNRFVIRAMWREKTRSLVAVVGVALGVAVMISIRLANISVTDSFRAAVDSVSGNTSWRIRGTAGRFDEDLFNELTPIGQFGEISPVIEAYAMVGGEFDRRGAADGFSRGEILQVLGVDVLLDFPLRDYQVVRLRDGKAQSAREVLDLLDDPTSVILTEKFLRRNNLRVGDEIPLTFGSSTQDYTIRGVLLNQGPARTLDGNFALMDIAAVQWAADRLGRLDYVDVMLDEGIDSDEALVEIERLLPTGLIVERPDVASSRADTMIAAFQFNLTALSAVALIVGLFLIYNTVSMSVASRRAEIGMLQAIGANRTTVLSLFLAEALALAFFGLLIGLPFGRLLGALAVSATAQTVETFYIAAIAESSASALRLTLTDTIAAVSIVVPLVLVAAFLPAWEAASVQPVEAVRNRGPRMSRGTLVRLAVAGGVCLLIGWLMTFVEPIGGRPVFGFLAEMMLMLGGALLTPHALTMGCAIIRGAGRRLRTPSRTLVRVATFNLESELPRVSVSVAALGISLSMMVAIAIMVGSFRSTVVYWLDSELSADLAIKPIMQSSSVSEARLSQQVTQLINNDPDVAETIWFRSHQIPYEDRNIRVTVTELDKTLTQGRLIFKTEPDAQWLAATGPPGVLVSESFALIFAVGPGASITLPTPAGSTDVQVAGVYYDYSSNQGTITMDAAVYQRLYEEADVQATAQQMAIYLRPDADVEQVRTRILNQLGEDELVYCVTSSEIRKEALKIFESTFAITYALQFIAILVAGLGVASTLIALIHHRRRDIGLLSLVGATSKQIRRVVISEAIIVGGVSQLIGILVGTLLAFVLIYVINVQSFGWTIQFEMPIPFVIQSTILVVFASAIFGFYPAVRAVGIDALQTVREEHA